MTIPSHASEGATRLHGAHILVVDDTEDAAEMLGILLTKEGATVVTAPSGADGLRAAQGARFDLIISDISMPEMDGYELLARLREIDGYGGTPAIALTGYGRNSDVDRAREAGFTTHLTKPVNFASLVALVRTTLHGPQQCAPGS